MKKINILFISFLVLSLSSFSQSFEYRTLLQENGYIAVQLQQTSLGGQPDPLSSVDDINDMVFEIRWLQSLGDVNVDLICSNYNITKSGARGDEGSYYFQDFSSALPLKSPDDYVLNTWVTIATIQTSIPSSTNTGTFEIAPDGWPEATDVLLLTVGWGGSAGTEYTADEITGNCDATPIPTKIYNYVWTGAQGGNPNLGKQWERNGNWSGTCPGDALPESTWPYYGQANAIVLIPSGLAKYPELTTGNDDYGWAATEMFIQNGAHVTVPDLATSTSNPELYIDGDLVVEGTLNLTPKGYATVTGTTTINSTEGIVVQADATGIGSFKDNGTIYGTGTAKVQTYLTNGASSGSFHIHLIGPTVDVGNIGGAPLSAFNYDPNDTYAYEYQEATDTWVNLVNPPGLLIPTAKGIGISTTDAEAHLLEMTGSLNYGTIYSPAMTTGGTGTGYNLLSNPYPSSIFWNDMYADNGSKVNDAVYVWDGSIDGGNYRVFNGSGGTYLFDGYIQVGQGFFVQATNAAGTDQFEFNLSQRKHSNDPFYSPNTMSNRLDVRIAGTNYSDGLLLHFYEGATSGYEANEDVTKRDSPYDEAPEIWTVLEDETRLSINAMPSELLSSDMLSVPMSFKCGLNDVYTLSVLDIESFEPGTEIWLEDKQTGEDWISITSEFEYSFTATPEDIKDRFEFHFFGPTGIDEFGIQTKVDIYSNQNFVYLVNNTDELIKKVEVYTLSGGLVLETKVPDQKAHKLYVANEIGYYLVRVTTDKNIYTEKIFFSY